MRFRWFVLFTAAPGLMMAADPATDILHKVAATYRDLKGYEVHVTAQIAHSDGASFTETRFTEGGAGPTKFRVEPNDPKGELRVADGQFEWLVHPASNEYAKVPLAEAAPTHTGALAEIDQHVKSAQIARTEWFVVNGKPVSVYVVYVERSEWPRGTPAGAENAMYRIDQHTFQVYKAIIYAPGMTQILLYSMVRWNQPMPDSMFHFEPLAGARQIAAAPEAMAAGKPLVGAVAPDFTLPDTGGNPYHLRDLQGKVVIVDFWATWCPPCRALMPKLQKMYVNWEKRGLVILGLDIGEDADQVEKFARQESYTFPLLIGAEPDISARYFVEAYPSTFVIDRLGHIVYRDLGGGDPAKLQAAVEKALGGH